MVYSCLVKDCPSRGSKVSPETAFFRLPSSEEMRGKWLANIKHRSHPGRVPKFAYVCHLHFSFCCFVPDSGGRRLSRAALPTLSLNYSDDSPVPHDLPAALEDSCNGEEPMDFEEPLFIEEHNYSSNISRKPQHLAKDLKKAILNAEILAMKNCAISAASRRWKAKAKKVSSLQKSLRQLFSREEVDHVVDGFEDTRLEFISSLSSKRKHKYPHNVREFACNVFFYSPRCYNYIRQHFHLPSVSLISKWTAAVTAMPGFQTPAMRELEMKMSSNPEKYGHVTLMLDGIHLKTKKEIVPGINGVFGPEDVGNLAPASKNLFFSKKRSSFVAILNLPKKKWCC